MSMKETKIHLDTPQIIFLYRVIEKVEGGEFTPNEYWIISKIQDILDKGYYSDIVDKLFLIEIRERYIKGFCI